MENVCNAVLYLDGDKAATPALHMYGKSLPVLSLETDFSLLQVCIVFVMFIVHSIP